MNTFSFSIFQFLINTTSLSTKYIQPKNVEDFNPVVLRQKIEHRIIGIFFLNLHYFSCKTLCSFLINFTWFQLIKKELSCICMNSRIQKLSENPLLQDKRFNVVVKIQLNIFCFNTIELESWHSHENWRISGLPPESSETFNWYHHMIFLVDYFPFLNSWCFWQIHLNYGYFFLTW